MFHTLASLHTLHTSLYAPLGRYLTGYEPHALLGRLLEHLHRPTQHLDTSRLIQQLKRSLELKARFLDNRRFKPLESHVSQQSSSVQYVVKKLGITFTRGLV